MASPSDDLWRLAARLEESTKRAEATLTKLETLLNSIVIRKMIEQRKQFAVSLRHANNDRKQLRSEIVMLHKLLNEQVKDMQPKITGNQHGRTIK